MPNSDDWDSLKASGLPDDIEAENDIEAGLEDDDDGDDDLEVVLEQEDDDPDDTKADEDEDENETDGETDSETDGETDGGTSDSQEVTETVVQAKENLELADDELVDEYDDLEDEYTDFVDEEFGFAEIDWDTLPEKKVDLYNRVRALSKAELDKYDLSKAGDLVRWAAARAYLEHGDEVAFHDTALPLIDSKERSPALDYVDIVLGLMYRRARHNDFDGAFGMLDKLKVVAPDDEQLHKRFLGIVTIQSGKSSPGLEILTQLAETRPDDANFLLSIGEDLCGIGIYEEALEFLEFAGGLARKSNDTELLACVENAVQFAQSHLNYDDAE